MELQDLMFHLLDFDLALIKCFLPKPQFFFLGARIFTLCHGVLELSNLCCDALWAPS